VIGDLPKVRSGLSRVTDSHQAWLKAIRGNDWSRVVDGSWYVEGPKGAPELRRAVSVACRNLIPPEGAAFGTGGNVIEDWQAKSSPELSRWYASARPDLVFNHQSRGHMAQDLCRYLFAAVFAQESKFSPTLSNFPSALLPDHANAVVAAVSNNLFTDRFRVQLADSIPTTVTSHISKDGHGFIHYDPTQCRSLTVREAARIQTFPDDYCFLGSRTAQYHQVGNAVPPYLAFQIAESIALATGGLG
jgi:DNA (cytosine-5)-methyltransferase 1